MILRLGVLVALFVAPTTATAAPIAYEVQPGSSITQCPGAGSLAPCVVGSVEGVVELDEMLATATLGTSGASIIGEPSSLDLAPAIWTGLDQLLGTPAPVRPPFPVWQFEVEVSNTPFLVFLARIGDLIQISGGVATTIDYTGPEVMISVDAVQVPEPGSALLLLPFGLTLIVLRRRWLAQ